MKNVYYVIALVALLGWGNEVLKAKTNRKYAYISGCFEASAISFHAVAKKDFSDDELNVISNICKKMYPEYLIRQKN